MDNSALTYTLIAQKSLSMCNFIKSKLDNILLVEGYTDLIFYSRFLHKKEFSVFFKADEERNPVKNMVLNIFLLAKNVYGIIDPDYKNDSGIDDRIRDRIHIIDANSLETLIIKYSDKNHNVPKAISNFDKLFRKGKIIQNAYKYNKITDDVLKWSFYIGCIRKINDLKNLRLKFKLVKEKSNFYSKYIIKSEENYNKVFNQDFYLKDICDESGHKNDSSFLLTIKNEIEEYNEVNVWDICQGHDIFDFIECLNSSSHYSETSIGKMPQNRMNTIPKWEFVLLKTFDTNNFISSPLQKWFDEIQS